MVAAGQAVHTSPGEWVRYSTPGPAGAEYISVCRRPSPRIRSTATADRLTGRPPGPGGDQAGVTEP